MPIQAGVQAPEFALKDETNRLRRLTDFRGKPLVLYFYPKDDTPGCTTEACELRDDYSSYENTGVVILGVSPDTPESHAKFKIKYNLPFTLLADDNHQICEEYGVWGPKKFMGRSYEGVHRTTFLIGPDGKILQVFENVKPAGHSAEILNAVKAVL